MKNYIYQNTSTAIFCGFYESPLYNSGTEDYINELNKENGGKKEYALDWGPYQDECCNIACNLLNDVVILSNNDPIITKIKFYALVSPQYYNYTTDKLQLKLDFNLNKLKAFIKERDCDFHKYLRDNFTSYDGFVENNYRDFKYDYYHNNKDMCIRAMLEYYVLACIYGDGDRLATWAEIENQKNYNTYYHNRLFKGANEALYEYIKEVNENI